MKTRSKTLMLVMMLFLGSPLSYADGASKNCGPGNYESCLESCFQKKNAKSCVTVAEVLLRGESHEEVTLGLAFIASQTGCEKNLFAGCYMAGIAQVRGESLYPPLKLSETPPADYFRKACEAKKGSIERNYRYSACLELSHIELQSESTQDDGFRRLKSICSAKFGVACRAIGSILYAGTFGQSKDKDRALKYWIEGCKKGDKDSCAHAGRYLIYEEGTTQKKQKQGIAFLNRSCPRGKSREPLSGSSAMGCSELGVLHFDGGAGLMKDWQEAERLFKFACSAKDTGAQSSSCFNLAQIYIALGNKEYAGNITSEPHRQRAADYYKLACNLLPRSNACDYYEIVINNADRLPRQTGPSFCVGCPPQPVPAPVLPRGY